MHPDALVLIDMQEHYVRELQIGGASLLLPRQKALIERYRGQGLPIVNILQEGHGGAMDEIQKELTGYPRHFDLRKPFADAFQGTDLDGLLRREGTSHLLLSGVYAIDCVGATLETAARKGYHVSTSLDLVADHMDTERHLKRRRLDQIRQAYADRVHVYEGVGRIPLIQAA